jgi:hypothetical protein
MTAIEMTIRSISTTRNFDIRTSVDFSGSGIRTLISSPKKKVLIIRKTPMISPKRFAMRNGPARKSWFMPAASYCSYIVFSRLIYSGPREKTIRSTTPIINAGSQSLSLFLKWYKDLGML